MRRYLRTVAGVAAACSEEDAERWRRIDVVWADDPSAVDDDRYARDGEPADVSLYEEMGEIGDDVIAGAPSIMRELKETCYGLAASYELQRYMMRSFHAHSHDVDPIYELNWVHGCEVWFDATTRHVYDRVAHAAWKRARASEAAG